MTPRMSLRPTAPRLSLAPTAEDDRVIWKRNETALAVTAVAGVVEAIVASWIVAIAMRDLLAAMQVEATAGVAPIVDVAIARVGLVVAEAIGALALSVAAGAL